MLAIPNLNISPRHKLPPWTLRGFRPYRSPLFLALLLSLLWTCTAASSETTEERVKRRFDSARAALEQNPQDVTNAWQFARACFDAAELAKKSPQQASFAEQGIAACRKALSDAPKSAPTHYYLALNLGELAQTKSFGALKLVEEMERELKTAVALDPTFDFAGPHRSIGLLYAEAPGWPLSVGNRGAAEKNLLKAVELSPEYPDNQLCLIENYLKWDSRTKAKARLEEARKRLEAGRETFAGDDWQSSWQDWDRRWTKVLKKLD